MSLFDREELERTPWARSRTGTNHRNPRFGRIATTLALSFLFGAVAMTESAMAESYSGYVKPTALNVREAPGAKSPITGILLKYDPVIVTAEKNIGQTRWYSIEASGGYVKGWVAARFVARGEAPAGTLEAEIDYGARETPTLMRGNFKYVGVRVCAECHDESTGDFDLGAFPVWQSHFHSQANKSLQRDYTKEIASRTRGVDDPATDWRCVKCHQTAFGAGPEQTASTYRPDDGVGCEVCHGPGSEYAQEDHGPDVPNRGAMGFRVLRDLSDRREVCTSCHNKASPTFIGFDLREFSRKIAHWVDKEDADYYAEYDKEANRRTSKVQAPAPPPAPQKAATQAPKQATKAAAGAATGAAGAAGAATSSAAREAEKAADAAAAASRAEEKRMREKAERERAQAEAASQAERKRAEAAQAEAARKAEQARAESEAAARAEARRKEDAARAAAEAARKKPAPAPMATAATDPLARYLEDVDDVIYLNEDGKKYKKAKFNHRKHATGAYLSDMTCQTCHHTQEEDESPQACNECHDIGGDADEEKAKKRYVHTKGMSWPKEPDQEQISCVSCHKVMNELHDAGERTGKKAPIKCTQCHARNK